jgi:protein TonB
MAQAEKKSGWVKVVVGLVVLAVLSVGGWLVATMDKSKATKPKAPKIALLAPPPPPPPPPPKEEKKPEPPKEVKEVKMEQQAPKQDSPPPSPELKMEGAAGNGPSAFAAGKVSNEDLSKVGKGIGGEGGGGRVGTGVDTFGNYANLIKGELQRGLRRNKSLKEQKYTVEVKIWLSPSGSLDRVELGSSTGDLALDELIKAGIVGMPAVSQTPPNGMPQPIRLRIAT